MEPAIIDWNIVKSEEYVPDEVYEHIDAPKWLDLSASSPPPVDDDAYFCRPDCRHPKTAEIFQTWSPTPKAKPIMTRTESDTMPLGERNNNQRDGTNLKRRGGVATLLHSSSSTREPVKSKGNAWKFRLDDLENRDPNISSGATPGRPVKVAKEAVKSSALKRGTEEEEEMVELTNKKPVPKLKSTLSARNLFSGRDIMSQLSEFCNEIKKLAVGKEKPTPAKVEAKEEERKVSLESSPKKNEGSVKRSSRLTVKVLSENSLVLREVRACPPTPQRFPSPSSHRLRSTKAAAAGTSSPLQKPPRSTALERGKLQELDRSSEENRTLVTKDYGNCTSTAVATDAEGSSSSTDMFWFLKPCTYLV